MKAKFLIFLFISANAAYAQKDSVLYEIQYKITQYNPTSVNVPKIQHKIMLVGKNWTVDKDLGILKRDTAYGLNSAKSFVKGYPDQNLDPNVLFLSRVNQFGADGQSMYDFKRGKFFDFKLMFNAYYFEQNIPKYSWKVQEDRKDILGYRCRKAIGTSQKLKWEVWFAEEHPIPYSLFGIRGLGGLVVQATETTTQTSFELVNFNKGSSLFKTIELPNTAILTSKEEVDKLTIEFLKDRKKFLEEHPLKGTVRKH